MTRLPLAAPADSIDSAGDSTGALAAAAFFDRPVARWVAEWRGLAPQRQVEAVARAFYREPRAARPWELARGPSLARALRERLESLGEQPGLPPLTRAVQSACGTEKLLLELGPEREVEAVLIPAPRSQRSRAEMQARLTPGSRKDLSKRPRRASGCVSTQVGCAVGCTFCASGLEGYARNLSAAQIVRQVLWLRERAEARGHHLGNVVFMGMGEPLHNLRAVQTALANLADPCGAQLGVNHLTVSTIGVPRGIAALQSEGPHVNLALSLHSACDQLRGELVPLAKSLPPVRELCEQLAGYAQATKRQVTISYVLLGGLNDAPSQAQDLARLLSATGLQHVNLIPWNAVEELPFREPPPSATAEFFATLRRAGLAVHVRATRGAEEAAACGQLRRQDLA